MGVGRLAPHRVRAQYARALAEIPLPVRSVARIEPSAFTVIGSAEIAGRTVEFGLLPGSRRVWVAFGDGETVAAVLGSVTGLDSTADGGPELNITDPDHLEWARAARRSAQIKRAAVAAWQAATRDCEG